ncbi:FAD-dependent pyridine nucleotide-disulfide oxidoreductase [Carpediemonas membranifera]|uniref:FAD-dependent pyridine nucleotide-disulfide oxidoreductase n=1 Tax=Carpediemonas membranifera TaxID=201153 RepID=A0A8J6API1_9EUKA|nr:FAD-dependent pyridine nucleotide-disulfide oxidoreductase [Carpediemonas membranifera]|eukprot:KAG9389518.1 FAD-dependent pyridine nucleotide-disulfide oxidoreductase [Carpediemonas membranifera]
MSTGEEQCLASPYQFMHKLKAIVVGGGFSAVATAKYLHKTHGFETTVIAPNSHFCFIPDIPITFLQPKTFSKRQVSLAFECDHVQNFIQGRVTAIDYAGQEVTYIPTLEGYDPVLTKESYDVLVLAHGLSWAIPTDTLEAFSTTEGAPLLINGYDSNVVGMEGTRTAVQTAKNIVVIGSGATGIEYATYIAKQCPEAKVSILSRSSEVLAAEKLPKKTRKQVDTAVSKLGVDVHPNVTNIQPKEGGLTYMVPAEEEGAVPEEKTIDADVVVWAAGTFTAPDITVSMAPEVEDQPMGRTVDVDTHLNVLVGDKPVPFVWAVGSCARIDDKSDCNFVHYMDAQAKLAARNMAVVRKQVMKEPSRGQETLAHRGRFPQMERGKEYADVGVDTYPHLIYLGKKTLFVEYSKSGKATVAMNSLITRLKYAVWYKYFHFDM